MGYAYCSKLNYNLTSTYRVLRSICRIGTFNNGLEICIENYFLDGVIFKKY